MSSSFGYFFNNSRVSKIAHRVGLGPEPDLAAAEGAIVDGWNHVFPVKQTMDLVAFALDRNFLPDICRNTNLRTDDVTTFAVHDFVKTESVAEGTGSQHIKIGFILITKNDAGHLFDSTAHRLESRRKRKITKGFVFENQYGKMLVGRIL